MGLTYQICVWGLNSMFQFSEVQASKARISFRPHLYVISVLSPQHMRHCMFTLGCTIFGCLGLHCLLLLDCRPCGAVYRNPTDGFPFCFPASPGSIERMPEQYIRNSQLLEFTEAEIPHTSGYIRVFAGLQGCH